MVRKFLVITILTILVFGTISSFLVSYNYSGIGTSISSYNSAFAAKVQIKASNDNSNSKSESHETLKQQEKVTQLSHEATNARLDAKLADDVANNATDNAKSLSASAVEADREVRKLQDSAGKSNSNGKNSNSNSNNDNGAENKDLLAALTDAKEKHQAARLADKNAKELSDKADALNKAADKAEKMAIQAQKQLEDSVANNNNNGGNNVKSLAHSPTDNQNSESTKDDSSSGKNSKDTQAQAGQDRQPDQNVNSVLQSSQNNNNNSSTDNKASSDLKGSKVSKESKSSQNDGKPSTEPSSGQSDQTVATAEITSKNYSSDNSKQQQEKVKEKQKETGTYSHAELSSSISNSAIADTNIVDNSSDSNNRNDTKDSQLQASTGTDFGDILAQAEKNAHNVTIEPLVTEPNKNSGDNSGLASNSSIQSTLPADIKDTQFGQADNQSSATNASVTQIGSGSAPGKNMTSVESTQGIGSSSGANLSATNSSDSRSFSEVNISTINLGSNIVNNTRNDTGINTVNKSLAGLNNTTTNNISNATTTSVNDTVPYIQNTICNIAIANTTSSPINTSGLNLSSSRQDDGGCYPNAAASGQLRYLVWSEGDEDNRFILFKRSADGGKTFDNAITLSGNVPSAVFNPKLSSDGNNVYVVWQGDSNSGNQDILMRKSTDNGKTFGSVINLSNDHAGSGNPEINVNASSVYVVWDGTTPGNNEIFYRRSLNNGSNFDSVRNLSNDGGVSYEPKVVLNKKTLEVYWRDFRNGHEDILVKRSINEGKTFDVLQKINKDILGLWKDRGVLDQRLNR